MATHHLDLTADLIRSFSAPRKGTDFLVDNASKHLVVRVPASGPRAINYQRRVAFVGPTGTKGSKKVGFALGRVNDLTITRARDLVRQADRLHDELDGDMDKIKAALFARQQAAPTVRIKTTAVLFNDLIKAYFEYNVSRHKWQEKTQQNYESVTANHVLPRIGFLLLEDVTDRMIRDTINAAPSWGIQRLVANVLRGAWKHALRRPDDFPINFSQPLIVDEAPQNLRDNDRPLDLQELRIVGRYLWSVLDDTARPVKDRQLCAAHLTCAYTALRVGSVVTLRASDLKRDVRGALDYAHIRAVNFKGQGKGQIVDGEATGNARDFTVKLNDGAKRVLATMPASDNALWYGEARKHLSYRRKALFWKPTGVQFRPHGWRKTFATMAAELGVHGYLIEIALGHSKASATNSRTADVYSKSKAHLEAAHAWDLWGDFLDWVLFTDADLGDGEMSASVIAAFFAWRDNGKGMLRAA